MHRTALLIAVALAHRSGSFGQSGRNDPSLASSLGSSYGGDADMSASSDTFGRSAPAANARSYEQPAFGPGGGAAGGGPGPRRAPPPGEASQRPHPAMGVGPKREDDVVVGDVVEEVRASREVPASQEMRGTCSQVSHPAVPTSGE